MNHGYLKEHGASVRFPLVTQKRHKQLQNADPVAAAADALAISTCAPAGYNRLNLMMNRETLPRNIHTLIRLSAVSNPEPCEKALA
jgi:hypothetical protein